MPDLTMCPGDECPIKNKCYRYRAVQELAQPYFRDIPFNFEKHECQGFKDINETSASVRNIDDKSWDLIVASDREKSNENK
tara:strand:+ start:2917 stop:3159 length:243 start_codon:yes stop_codon:yes gene_type:complete